MLGSETDALLGRPSRQKASSPRSSSFSVPSRYGIAALLITSQLLCAPLFSVTVMDMSRAFGWSKAFQGHAHSAFFLGYAVTGLPGGVLSDVKGGKWVLCVSYALMGACVVSTPWAASVSGAAGLGFVLLLSRVFMGLAEGVQSPSILSMVSVWMPRRERSTVLGAVHGGMYTGSVVGFIFAPLVILQLGWRSVWYVFGAAIFLWCIVWALFASNSPREHHAIDPAEIDLIEGNGDSGSRRSSSRWRSSSSSSSSNSSNSGSSSMPAPKSMLSFSALATDSATWAIVIAHFAHDWCWYVAVSWLPTYFVETHQLPVQTAALYSAFPFLTQLVTTLLAGSTADWLARSGKPSRVLAVRRAATTAGFLGSASFLVLSQWQPAEQPIMVMLCFCAAFGFDGMHVGGYLINAADIAPDHAGSVKGLGDTAGCLAGFMANIVVGAMSANHAGHGGAFYSTFLMLGMVQILGAAAYFMLADGKPRFGPLAETKAEAIERRRRRRGVGVGGGGGGGVGVGTGMGRNGSFGGTMDWGAGMTLGADESGADVLIR